ncbi:hypothetical protein EDC32_101995 [Laceyella sacchari]|jgi:hypothetical protein|nr:hypothetical protein EDC32_101995 [Laceyella sacchari]
MVNSQRADGCCESAVCLMWSTPEWLIEPLRSRSARLTRYPLESIWQIMPIDSPRLSARADSE